MVTYDSDKEGAREEALEEAEEEGKYTGGSEVTVGPVQDTETGEVKEPATETGEGDTIDSSNDTDSSDDSTTVVVPESPAERDKLKEKEGDYTLGQGSTNEQAIKDAADNPSFDADQDTELGAEERRQDTNQPLANPENSRPEEVQQAAQEIAASERFRGTNTGRQAGELAEAIEENQKNYDSIDIQSQNGKLMIVGERNRDTRKPSLETKTNNKIPYPENNTPKPVQGARDVATDLDNYLTDQARESSKEIQTASEESRRANTQLNPNSLNPVSFTAKGIAGLESAGSETLTALTTDEDFDLEEAGTVDEERVRELQGTIGGMSGFALAPLDTANLAAASTTRTVTSAFAEDEEQKAEDVTYESSIEFAESSFEQAKNNPTETALGVGLGLGLERGITRAVNSPKTGQIASKGKSALKQGAAKADPATGFGRTPRPGEQTPTTPERIRAKANSATDFLKGDIKPEVNRKPEARNVIMDTDPDGVRFENQEVVEERVPDPSQLSSEADDIVLDERGNIPVEVFERNRRDVVKEFLKDGEGEIKGITTTSKGQTKLVEPDLDNINPDNPSGRISDDFIDNRLRQPDSDSRPTLRERMDSNRRGRRRQTEFNKPKSDTGATSGLGLGVGAGLGAEQDLDEPQKPVQQPEQDQRPEEIIDNPLKQDQTSEQKFPETKDSEEPFLLQQPKEQIRDKPPRIGDRDTSRRKSPDFGSEDDGFDMPEESEDDFVGFENEGEFASSLTASLFDIEADEEFDEEQTFTGFEVRPLSNR